MEEVARALLVVYRAARLAELGRVAVIAFGSESHILTSLEDVVDEQILVRRSAGALSFTARSSNFASALDTARELFNQAGPSRSGRSENVLICLTDG